MTLGQLVRRQTRAPRIEDYLPVRERAQKGARVPSADVAAPKVSIITVVRNGEETIARTFASIRAQTYPNVEYIVVDGASTDATTDIIQQNLDIVSTWISEPDAGIYDGFNKGVALATGDYIGFVNSDDCYSPNQLEAACDAMNRTGCLWAVGDIWLYGHNGQDIFMGGDPAYDQVVRLNMPMLLQVTALCHRVIFAQVGLFRTNYRVAADYDWFLRVALAGFRAVYDPKILGFMWAGGISTRNQRLSVREGYLICIRNGHPIPEATLFWWLRYRALEAEPSAKLKDWVEGLRTRLRRRTGPQQAIPPGVTPPFLWDSLPEPEREVPPLLPAFACARHAGGALSEPSLLLLSHLLGRARSCVIVGHDEAADQARVAAEALGTPGSSVEEADVVVVSDVSALHTLPAHARYLVFLGGGARIEKVLRDWRILGGFSDLIVAGRRPST